MMQKEAKRYSKTNKTNYKSKKEKTHSCLNEQFNSVLTKGETGNTQTSISNHN